MKQNSGKILFLGGPNHGKVHEIPGDDRYLYPVVKVPIPVDLPCVYASADKVRQQHPDFLIRTATYRLHSIITGGNGGKYKYRFYLAEGHHADEWLDLLLLFAEPKSEKCLTGR